MLLGAAAWLAGASAATGGSLLAVSVLGQGMTPGGGDAQSVTTVNRALAKEAAERAAAMPRRTVPPRAAHDGTPSRVARHRAPLLPERRRAAVPGAGRSVPPPSPMAAGGTVLTSQGGTLVASCAGARAYLMSWSPQQGFASTGVVRGPATSAQVTFAGGQLTVTMIVSCDAGVPAATSTTVSTGGSATSTTEGSATNTSAGDGD
jgi:hypothetical protein